MEEAEAMRLREVLSVARIAEYEALCDGQTRAALRLHCWNTEICAAFYGPLQYLEVGLRSALSRGLVRLFQRTDWWEEADQRLWRTALHRAFPGHRGGRRELHRYLDHLRVLRNKIAHHCPIHHRHLQADHQTILQCLGYIDADLACWVDRYSRVPGVLACRP